jgi:hypothetical protein
MDNPLSYSKAEHYRKFMEWKNGAGAHWFNNNDRLASMTEEEKERERKIYSTHSLCVNGES